ncbi:MAG: mechanosensitive ion channel [Lachnospiraceae bacterium]|nr:mechanosensitive ion channel [Lachnospiraceae bacterium]
MAELSDDLNTLQKFLEELPDKLMRFGIKFLLALLFLFIGGKLISVIRKILKKSLQRANSEQGVIQFLDSLVKVVLYVLLCIGIASYFGLETTSFIAVLGSAGVTIALALQGSLSNFTGGVLILLLKPFRVGDYIKEDNKGNEGTVTEIQLFYTKLRTIDDKVIVLPNGTLANTSLTNVNECPIRRLILAIGISYSSDIRKAKEIIRKVLTENEHVLHDMETQIYVDALEDSQVTLGIRCMVKRENYFPAKWDMLEEIKEKLAEGGVEIPFPQMDVHLKEE